MLFNSIDFATFLPFVFCVFWILNKSNLKIQNVFILLSSYVFYGWWDWRFLSLIAASTLVDFILAKQIFKTENKRKRKLYLLGSLSFNLGLLGVFKYYNFFIENFVSGFSFFGINLEANHLNLILPVGISFYTFQTLSYTIDVYRNKLKAVGDPIVFATYVSFFPQLVAGPIERATHLIPQFEKRKSFNYQNAKEGLQIMLWGFFKKMVIADNCSLIADQIFNNYPDQSGGTLFIASVFFAFQIYGDFSGYSDIAIGLSKLFGFDLMKNFRFPYFSRDIAEFWRRWHISLSTWFRDYIYIPLGGSRVGKLKVIRNIFIIFLVSGFWHGANWTYITWGAINAVYFAPYLLLNRNRNNTDKIEEGRIIPKPRVFLSIIFTFCLTCLAWIFFRSDSMEQSINILTKIFSPSLLEINTNIFTPNNRVTILLLILFIIVEWLNRNQEHTLVFLNSWNSKIIRWSVYSLIIFLIECTHLRQKHRLFISNFK